MKIRAILVVALMHFMFIPHGFSQTSDSLSGMTGDVWNSFSYEQKVAFILGTGQGVGYTFMVANKDPYDLDAEKEIEKQIMKFSKEHLPLNISMDEMIKYFDEYYSDSTLLWVPFNFALADMVKEQKGEETNKEFYKELYTGFKKDQLKP